MTVVVTFLCSDGVVVAADSMLTASMGNTPIAQHTGKKVDVLAGNQVFAFAGDQGLAARFRIMADGVHAQIPAAPHPMDYGLHLSQNLSQQFQSTAVGTPYNLATAVAFQHGGGHHCCLFYSLQPFLLDGNHFYAAFGSGKLAADPFLRFLVDTFCQNGQPTVREALFLATWTIEHVIHTTPGGVGAPIRIGVLEAQDGGGFAAREVPDDEIEEHRQAVADAEQALREWRDGIQSGGAAAGVPDPPQLQPGNGGDAA